jgi:hypothetical protein
LKHSIKHLTCISFSPPIQNTQRSFLPTLLHPTPHRHLPKSPSSFLFNQRGSHNPKKKKKEKKGRIMLFTGVIWLSLGFSMLVLSLCEEFLNIFGGVGRQLPPASAVPPTTPSVLPESPGMFSFAVGL